MRFHHVQVGCPVGGEPEARRFYGGLLGLPEVAKPDALAARGGCWFRDDGVEVHVGVELDFRPAAKTHPAFEVEGVAALERLAARLVEGGHPVRSDPDFPGYQRFYTDDGHGNRVELLARSEPGHARQETKAPLR